ncbi:aldose epimerase [Thermogymnomonas acidicola]|uniref:Aldose epimerase n=1 Tax=Thermogymnomonas acidicola TaxID=399579 RepID=A0AA37BSF1_9ARCH|nr:aldose 1-epimerase [Thermogymnomonas acidicola]GGM76287.1 aldose epimerase [Thermogymnomonas acidicola]
MIPTRDSLSVGSSTIVYDSTGAWVESLVLRGRQVIVPPRDGKKTHGGSAFLFPFANRVKGASYRWRERVYELPRNDGENSIHGLVLDRDFEATKHSDRVEFHTDFEHPGYPGRLQVHLAFVLRSNRFLCRLTVRNESAIPLPLSPGFHPYFAVKGPYRISVVGGADILGYRQGYFPDGTFRHFDFEGVQDFSSLSLDNCFRGMGSIRLSSQAGDLVIRRRSMRFFVIYNGQYAPGGSVAIEPMVGAPDAFNNGIGLRELGPGSSATFSFSVEVL